MATPSFLNEYDNSVVFVTVPFPVQSHLNQLLHLSCLIHALGFPVHFAASAIHCRQAKLRNESAKSSSGITFHQLPTPPFLSSPPEPEPYSKNFPDHLWPSMEASMGLREPVAALLRELSSSAGTRRLVIIHDSLMNYVVQDAASLPNAESYSFFCGSAFSLFCVICQFSGKPFPVQVDPDAVPSLENCTNPDFKKFFDIQTQFDHLRHGILFNTCQQMEGPYLHLLAEVEKKKKKQWAIAPLFPVRPTHIDNSHPTLEWLDQQPPKSVIYVSFGSVTPMSHEQIKELARGLEQSKQRFLWVLRDADRGDIFKDETKILLLPEGFEERVKEVGIVTRDWVPQLGILQHPSVGGFLSHCGWNSCQESLTMGVPLATWPMHSDQPFNALYLIDILKVGVPVIGWGERHKLVTSSAIKKSIEVLMTSEGHEVRRRAEELGEVIRQSIDKGEWELNSFLDYVVR